MSLQSRIRNVTAVLGPTNTGKTHLAIERMLGHPTGMIGLPLRLLAREVYDKIVAKVGVNSVALITGEEKIKPDHPRFWVSTVEAMPREIETDFLAIDEVQLCADPERGHVFTDRVLNARGREETLLLGAGTMRDAINELIPGANFISRPRLSKISYAGQKKMTRLPKRTAIVAFSAAEVYANAELIRRQMGGAAVVLGALSPRTRNAQVALYQSGDVDYLIATDAIGMGLNLDVDHVAFSAVRKFDGHTHRNLTAGELGQIAGRAGRHMNDGTFGVTGDAEPLDADLIERLENHSFDSVKLLQWRNEKLDFGSLDRLRESLLRAPREVRLQRARMAEDLAAFETVSAVSEIAAQATTPATVERLWEVCQVPDYRKISPQNHAELVATLFGYLMSPGNKLPEDWFAKQVEQADRTDGDIDTLATRIAHIRTWTYVSNRADWLADPAHWQARTRAVEDSLSDAMHEQLTQRFVDLKTSALVKGLRDKDELSASAEIASDGSVKVANHFVGRLKGFRFQPDTTADAQGVHGKASRGAAAHVLSGEFSMRARRVSSAKSDAFKLLRTGRIHWRDEEIARLEAGEDPLKPQVVILADEHLTGPDKDKVQARLDAWIAEAIGEKLKSLVELKNAEDVTGLARGIAFRMVENFGALKRETVADDMRQLDQPSRAQLRKYGVRFGAFNIFLPLLLKPGPADLIVALWTLKHGAAAGIDPETPPEPPRAGLTSSSINAATPEAFYRAAGYHACGPRGIRIDILERLADLIRPLLAWRRSETNDTPPKGSSGDGGFIVTPEMMSILGCSSDELGNVLKALGFRLDRRPAPPKPVAKAEAAVAAQAGSEVASTDVAATPVPSVADAVATEAAASVEAVAPEPPTPAEAPSAAAEPHEVATETPMSADATPASAEPSTAAAEPAPSEAPAEVTTEAKPAEPEMIDIWRPRRREREQYQRGGERGDRQERPRGDRGDRRPGGNREGANREGANRDGGNRDRNNRNRNRDRNAPAGQPAAQAGVAPADGQTATVDAAAAAAGTPGAEANAGDTQGVRREHQGRDRRDNRGNQNRDNRSQRDGDRGAQGPRREGDRAAQGPRRDGDRGPQGPRRDGDRRDDRGGREGRRDDRRRDDRGSSRPQEFRASPSRKGPDPDSPFAALSALKQALENKGKDRT